MQPTGILIVLVRELPARMEFGQNHLDAGQLFFGVFVDRHTATIVLHLDRSVFVDGDFDFLAVTGECFVDAVVDDLVGQVIRTRGIRIHPRAPPHGLQTA